MSSEQAGGTPGSGAVSDRMRALLSRAAEEQLLEQRQVSTVLGELRALLEDVDERLATGEHVERVTAEVRALSARVEDRLDAAEARSAELAERISGATELVGRVAQDLVEAVAAGVAERVEAQFRDLTASLTASAVAGERRLATHVDDAVLALAEVVLRRRSAQGSPPAAPPALGDDEGRAPSAAEDGPSDPGQVEDGPSDVPQAEDDPVAPTTVDGPPAAQPAPGDDLPTGPPAEAAPDEAGDGSPGGGTPAHDGGAAALPGPTDTGAADDQPPPPTGPPADGVDDDAAPDDEAAPPLLVDPATAGLVPASGEATPGDGFVLVPADVEQPDAGPAPPVPHERRTGERRSSERADGSGRRRRPWWRPV